MQYSIPFGYAARGSISSSVVFWSLGGVDFQDNNQQQHDATVYYTINNLNINMQ
jgi:hypothetical protein